MERRQSLSVRSALQSDEFGKCCGLHTLNQTSIGALRAVVINYVSCIKRRLIHRHKVNVYGLVRSLKIFF